MSAALKKLAHVAARQLGLDTDARRAVQLRVTGKGSLADMSEGELARLIDHFKAQGFVPASPGTGGNRDGKGRPKHHRAPAPRPDLRYVHVLWRLLADAGRVKVRGAKGLNAFIAARFANKWGAVPIDVDALQDASQIADVIEALKDWCQRAGIACEP